LSLERVFKRDAATQASVLTDDETFPEIVGQADEVASYARSIAEAAFRRDTVQLRIYRAEFRSCANSLMGLIRDVAPIEIEGGRA
jgi:hypothetical protein